MHSIARKGLFARVNERILPYLLVGPTFLFILIWLVAPLGYALYSSFWRCDYLQYTKPVGLENYITVLSSPSTLWTIGRTLYISVVSLFFALLLGVLLALWINASKGMMAYSIQITALIP